MQWGAVMAGASGERSCRCTLERGTLSRPPSHKKKPFCSSFTAINPDVWQGCADTDLGVKPRRTHRSTMASPLICRKHAQRETWELRGLFISQEDISFLICWQWLKSRNGKIISVMLSAPPSSIFNFH